MSRRDRILLTATFVAYVAVVFLGVAVHEPWWDEAQSWLLARDAPIAELLTRDLAYEGHPPLWYLILAIPARLHLPYKSIDVVSSLIGIAGVVLLLRLRRVPIAARIILPFTLYCAYQYTVVSRSYVLLPPLLFAILAIYEERDRRIIPFALLLVGLSEVSLYGVALAAGLVLLFVIDLWRGRLHLASVPPWKVIMSGSLVVLHTIALAVLLRLPSDLSSRAGVDLTFRISSIAREAWPALSHNLIIQADEPRMVIFALLMTIVLGLWLWRRDAITEFVVLFAVLLPVAAIYFSPWHEGIFFWTMAFVVLRRCRVQDRGRAAMYWRMRFWSLFSVRTAGGHSGHCPMTCARISPAAATRRGTSPITASTSRDCLAQESAASSFSHIFRTICSPITVTAGRRCSGISRLGTNGRGLIRTVCANGWQGSSRHGRTFS